MRSRLCGVYYLPAWLFVVLYVATLSAVSDVGASGLPGSLYRTVIGTTEGESASASYPAPLEVVLWFLSRYP